MTQQLGRNRTGGMFGRANTDIRIATGLRAANQSIAWIGAKTGIFAKQGLNVTFPGLEVGGPECVAGLLRGDWDFAHTGTVPIAEAVLRGGDTVILLRDSILQDKIIIMANSRITSLDQLSGKKVGVLTDVYSGQTGVIVRLTVERAGAAATYVGLGTYGNLFAALVAGDIDAAALPVDYQFLQEGQHSWNCFEAQSLNVPVIFAATRRAITADRELVVRVLRGYVEAIHQFKTQPGAVQEFLGFRERSTVLRLHEHYASVLPVVPRPELSDGMQQLRDHFIQRYPSARALQEVDIVDASLIDELEQSGFIAQLYDRSVELPT